MASRKPTSKVFSRSTCVITLSVGKKPWVVLALVRPVW